MTGLSMVRMISHVGERLALRLGSGGQPTARLQDKSREVRPGRSAEERETLQRRQTMCAPTPRCAHSEIPYNFCSNRTSHMEPP